MNKYILQLLLSLFYTITSLATTLPDNYSLTDSDYELVGNEQYHNFDVRSGKYESDPLVILQKLNTILYSHFTADNGDAIVVYFKIYDGTASEISWDLYVENNKYRTTEYVLDDNTEIGYKNLGSSNTLDICTWNIEHYPKNSSSQSKVIDIILESEIDVFGLQEIADDKDQFTNLLDALGGDFEGYIYNPDPNSDPNFDQNIAFIYKKDEISIITPAREITELKDSYSFPRTPIEIKLKHNSGAEFIIINNHLKCCSGSEDRRRKASEELKTYIDSKYKSSNISVVVLGDLNDRIDSGESDNVFENFIDDSSNYVFTDTKVSEDSQYGGGWTNIDHILINKPLFQLFDKEAEKLKASDFDFNYDSFVSDHFPVWVNLNTTLLSNEVNYIYKSGLDVFPNPSSNSYIDIKTDFNIKNQEVKVFNLQGLLLINREIDSTKLDVSNLKKGIYIITLNKEGILYTSKFSKL